MILVLKMEKGKFIIILVNWVMNDLKKKSLVMNDLKYDNIYYLVK